jgi:hypothetical protein
MGTKYTLKANWDITLLAVGLTSLVRVEFTGRKNQLYLSVLEIYDVMLLVFELVYVFTNTVHTQTELTVIAELLGRLYVTKVTEDDLLGPSGGRGHCLCQKPDL